MSQPVVETEALEKRYGRRTALRDLTIHVEAGETFGFLGPNGAGKTTAVKLLLGLSRPTAGQGRVLGAPLGDLGARRRIGYLPELFRYQGWLRAREVLELHCRLARLPTSTWRPAIDEALGTVGLADRAGDRVDTFSKGMQQRLGLGVAILGRPALVVLDEPTSALDPVGRREVRDIVRDLAARGSAVFLNSHLLTEVERVCDRVAIVDQGRVLATGRVDELLGRPTVRIRFEAPTDLGRSEAMGAITAIPGILAPPMAADDGTTDLLFEFEGDTDRVPDIVALLVGRGLRIRAVEPIRPTLEEHFLDVIGARADPGAGR